MNVSEVLLRWPQAVQTTMDNRHYLTLGVPSDKNQVAKDKSGNVKVLMKVLTSEMLTTNSNVHRKLIVSNPMYA